MKYVLGFDPGGAGRFGWAVCAVDRQGLQLVNAGDADNAISAADATLSTISTNCEILGLGIDAPMYWVYKGNRKADEKLRQILRDRGAKSPGGTVQHFNSLRGACIVQGSLIAQLMRERLQRDVPITEAHPKALLWLLGIATKTRHPNSIEIEDVPMLSHSMNASISEHQRDAALAAFGAWAMVERRKGWVDFLSVEHKPVLSIPKPIGYWMPDCT